ncbi:hypothetical protein [Thalassospira sp.]|uniref:hypothetical protein n=1 Tax=Thalassospira sp. TaxID=1912094 RepID=UPI003AA98FC1
MWENGVRSRHKVASGLCLSSAACEPRGACLHAKADEPGVGFLPMAGNITLMIDQGASREMSGIVRGYRITFCLVRHFHLPLEASFGMFGDGS